MPNERRRAAFKVVLLGLAAGGLCGAAVGLGLVPQAVGITAAVIVALMTGLSVLRVRRRAYPPQSS